jgi:putative NADH-flavin reductase
MTKILLLGGHGKVSLLLTPKLLARSWNVTSVIRNKDQIPAILETGKKGPGKVEPLVESIEDVKSVDDAGKVIDKAGGVDWVVWSAGMLLYIIMTHVKMQFH